MHSVFSDGAVWPHIRVEEALKDGLDCIAITEHIEYQPHKADIPHPDRRRAFEIASRAAANTDLIVIHGSEITRRMPPGHSNAIFITDPNKLITDDALDAYSEAKNQGGFIFWNHPDWTAHRKDGVAQLDQMHIDLIRDGLLNGIEVVNTKGYSAEAFQIALDNDLTIIGTSDIHGLIDWDYDVPHGHRPVTIVFSSDRTEDGIKTALFEGRTAVWHKNFLVGLPEYTEPLFQSSIKIVGAEYVGDTSVLSVQIRNHSDAEFLARNLSEYSFQEDHEILSFSAGSDTELRIKTGTRLGNVVLPLEVLNIVVAPRTYLQSELNIVVNSGE
ncbi:MAG: PHP domain-containing protein [Rhodothermales bacterium]|nr:PHP domain-containing protein [Rhodothermales bacterium]